MSFTCVCFFLVNAALTFYAPPLQDLGWDIKFLGFVAFLVAMIMISYDCYIYIVTSYSWTLDTEK